MGYGRNGITQNLNDGIHERQVYYCTCQVQVGQGDGGELDDESSTLSVFVFHFQHTFCKLHSDLKDETKKIREQKK